MTSFKTIIITYLVGGVTFLPLVVFAILYIIYQSIPDPDGPNGKSVVKVSGVSENGDTSTSSNEPVDEGAAKKEALRKEAEELLRSLENQPDIGVDVYMAGWLTVSREFALYQSGSPSEKQQTLNESAYTSIYKHLMDRKQTVSVNTSSTTPAPDKSKRTKKRPANSYFAILRHGNLFLYDSPEQMNVQQVIVLAHHNIGIWPPDVPDGQLFIRRHAICIYPKRYRNKETELSSTNGPPKNSYFLYSDNCSEKEDFYFSLVRASKKIRQNMPKDLQNLRNKSVPPYPDPLIDAHPLEFDQEDMSKFMNTINSSEAHLQTQWLNAILGRMFLGLHKTEVIGNFVKNRIDKKLSRIKRPSFLGDITVTKVFCGNTPPYFTNVHVKEMTLEGLIVLSADIEYEGDFNLEVATKATLNFGSRFKTREVSLVLSVAFQKLEGRLNFTLKPPPSNRLWYCFETMPKIVMHIEPVVSSRQITYSVVTRVIENRINEAIRDSLVAPYQDDFAFYDTMNDFFRGGIWDRSIRTTYKEEAERNPLSTSDSTPYQSVESHFQSELRHHADNLSISSSVSLESDHQSVFDDSASVFSHEIRNRKTDVGGDDDIMRRKRTSISVPSSAPAVVATDRVNIVVVDGQVVSHKDATISQYSTSPSSTSPLHRTSSRSSSRSYVSKSDTESVLHGDISIDGSSAHHDSSGEGEEEALSISSVETAKDNGQIYSQSTLPKRSASSNSTDTLEEKPSISASVRKWGNKYFTSAKKTYSKAYGATGVNHNNFGGSSGDSKIQNKLIESRLNQADDLLLNAPRPHTYPMDSSVTPDLSDPMKQTLEELNEGPSIFINTSKPHLQQPITNAPSYGPTSMQIPSTIANPRPTVSQSQPVSRQPSISARRKPIGHNIGIGSTVSSPTKSVTDFDSVVKEDEEEIEEERSRAASPTIEGPPPLPQRTHAVATEPTDVPSRSNTMYAKRRPVPGIKSQLLSSEETTPSSSDALSPVSQDTDDLSKSLPEISSSQVSSSSGTCFDLLNDKEDGIPTEDLRFPDDYSADEPKLTESPSDNNSVATTLEMNTSLSSTEVQPDIEQDSELKDPSVATSEAINVPKRARSQLFYSNQSTSHHYVDVEFPATNFADLVDEGNSLGFGSFDSGHHHMSYSSSYGSSPSHLDGFGNGNFKERKKSTTSQDTVEMSEPAMTASEHHSTNSP
ncbi:hypothetical protein V1511DRAFT_9136 [Dipodascopsis uninucleata]